MMYRDGWWVLALAALGCGSSDGSTERVGESTTVAPEEGGPPGQPELPDRIAELRARRARLLATADDYSFAEPPATTAEDCDTVLTPGAQAADRLIEAIEAADSYAVICLGPGRYAMDKSIVISDVSHLTVKGIGAKVGDTVLDFAGHEGDKGFDVTAPGFWIENMEIENTLGNGVEIKAEGTPDSPTVFRKLKVGWDVPPGASLDCGETDPRRAHGAYSVYPTRSSYVVVEFCEVEGASDAGLYVGQVQHGMVRHNSVHGNVAGLEVENSFDVVVYDNDAWGNSGGILALQEPGLMRLSNERVLIRDNRVRDNNGCNFAKPNATVASIPAGTGLMSFAGHDIEFRGNRVTGNAATGLLLASNVLLALLEQKAPEFPEGYDPYVHDIGVHGNTFENNATAPAPGPAGQVGLLAGGFRDVTWDGFRAAATASAANAKICLGESDGTFVDITQGQCAEATSPGAFGECVAMSASMDRAAHGCRVSVDVRGF